MTVFEDLIASLAVFETHMKTASDQYQEAFVDKAIPLDQRWTLFCRSVELGIFRNENGYGLSFDFMKAESWEWYDDFCTDRYKTVHLVELVEDVIEKLWGDIGYQYVDGEWQAVLTDSEFDEIIEPKVTAMKEEILACGYSSFIFDW